ncbi:cytochrome P450 2C19-like [Sceloporus undulatus]|uniref:cytochrome P450 2C19-like n=1 Tax=Sceloporus undulatus TaxID=8520 RepID=UPI001C4D17BC|nr:cytochrome P450 2C19-like [Sceloporus undulatus]
MVAAGMEPLGTATIFLIVCLSCLVLSSIWKSGIWRKGKLPPGPFPLPIIGNALQLKAHHFPQALQKLSEKYGPVFTLHFGAERVVVLHGYEAIKEALIDRAEEFVARGKRPFGDKIRRGNGFTIEA